ncbi:oocyte zinc finger protein XlCOF6-like protein [Aphelenchoides avenae]|nr:oocyte zinc finger protein XlCOF6-like protein [Aphelenchus avenae]
MDPLVDAILSITKEEVKEEVENDAIQKADDLASVQHSSERSEQSSLQDSSEESATDAAEESDSDGVDERDGANGKRKRTAKPRKGRTMKDKTTFSCTECEYTSAYAQVLHRHMRRHTGQKPYKCNLCEKSFALKVTCDAHRRTHFAEKPFKCAHCDYACNQKPNLITHERTHLGKQFECPQCAAKFSLAQTLHKHMQLHTEQTFTCELCGHKSNTKANANKHLRYGRCNKQSKFKCEHCNFRTSSAFYLRDHVQRRYDTGTGRCRPRQIDYVKYYTCPTCRHTTPSKSRYEAHLRRRKDNKCPNRGTKRMNAAFPVTFDRAQCRLNQGLDPGKETPGPSGLKRAGRKRIHISDSDDSD